MKPPSLTLSQKNESQVAMPTVLKIELDASKAERDLAQFRSKVESLKTQESRPAEKTISVKVETKGATAAIARTGKELKAATVPAETFRTRASAAFRNVWKDLSDGEGLVKNLTGALKGVLSPVGAIGLGMAALGKIAVDVWDRMTLSAAEYLERSGRAADVAEKKREKLQAEQAQELRHLAALRELASQETLSNTAKQEAGVLLDQLSAKYGSLGVAIDKTGNRLTGFDKAQEKILSKMRRDRIAAGEETYSRLQDKAFAQVQYAVTGMTPGEETLNKFGLSLRGAQSAKRTAAEVMRSQPLEKQLEFARHMMTDESRTQEEMDRWGKAVDVLEQMVERRKELKALERTGFASEEERANAYRENAALDASVRRNGEQAAQTASDRAFAAERDPEGKIANREKLIAGELEKQKRLHEEIAKAERQTKQGDFENQRLAAKKRMLELTLQLQESEGKIAGWSEQIAQIKNQTAQRQLDAKRQLDESREELAIQQALVKGEYDKAEALRLQLEQRKAGRQYSASELAEIKKQNAERQSLNLQRGMQDQAWGSYIDILKRTGNGKQAEMETALRNAERTKGGKLTNEETELVKRLTELTHSLGSARGASLGDTSIRTNELTARGGFAGGVRLPEAERYNEAMLSSSKRIEGYLPEIKAILSKLGYYK
nr:MAG TPA: chromosome segregation protein [Caudoviricetes sp.]